MPSTSTTGLRSDLGLAAGAGIAGLAGCRVGEHSAASSTPERTTPAYAHGWVLAPLDTSFAGCSRLPLDDTGPTLAAADPEATVSESAPLLPDRLPIDLAW
ncbi:hypothetical protein [Halobaculum sp. EA56]|uniref:hypothetical protein n=1 Tax=Halobaculum sp. EA56 TaxID=3421648 RepID=UPI003EB9AD28